MPVTPDPAPSRRPSDLLVRLGGGTPADLADQAERSAYTTCGALVVLAAVAVAAVVAATAVTADAPVAVAAVLALGAAAVAAALGRALASPPEPAGGSIAARAAGAAALVAVAVLAGLLVGELAVAALTGGPTTRFVQSQREAARADVATSERARGLDRLRAERVVLDQRVAAAAARYDTALVTARCEYRPGPDCPSARITGEPGDGPAAGLAEQALAAADAGLSAATAAVPVLDERIAREQSLLDADLVRAEDLAAGDTGPLARWQAMHAASGTPVVLLRGAVDALAVLLLLAPLLLRLRRGRTAHDRGIAARRRIAEADEEARIAVAVGAARTRAALELRRQQRLLDDDAVGPGTVHVAVAAPSDPADRRALTTPDDADDPAALPVPAGSAHPVGAVEPARPATAVPAGRRDPLDLLPGPLPGVARAVTGLVSPLVPGPVTRLVADAAPVRIVRRLLEEAEELTITVRRTRQVRVEQELVEDPAGDATAEVTPGSAAGGGRRVVTGTTVRVDRDDHPSAVDPAATAALDAAGPKALDAHRPALPPGT
jgi:hypothetical protein